MLRLSAVDYSTFDCDDLLRALKASAGLHLVVDGSVAPDCLRTLLVLSTLASQSKRLHVELPSKSLPHNTVASLHRALLAPLVWQSGRPVTRDLEPGALTPVQLTVSSKKHRYFVSHTSQLRASDPNAFEADLVAQLREAGIVLPRSLLAPLTTIGFEATSNAEEYGYRSFNPSDSVSFRIIATIVHDSNEGIAPLVAPYFRQYYEAGHSAQTRWLELLVVDAGVGLALPRWEVSAAERGSQNANLYSLDHALELFMLRLVLQKGESTKGSWGRILNRHTAYGRGLKQIKQSLATSRSCAIVRCGRSVAYWYRPRLKGLESMDLATLPPYEPAPEPRELYCGTAWQVLLPLDPQFALPL